MSDPLDRINAPFQGLIENLAPTRRRRLARELASKLRQSQAKRIASQRNPDGSPFEPRKPQARKKRGRIRRTMFSKMRTTKHLKTMATDSSATVFFTGRTEQIAKVHQFGLRDRVNARRQIFAKYPSRLAATEIRPASASRPLAGAQTDSLSRSVYRMHATQ